MTADGRCWKRQSRVVDIHTYIQLQQPDGEGSKKEGIVAKLRLGPSAECRGYVNKPIPASQD